jgi:sulfur carrier protein
MGDTLEGTSIVLNGREETVRVRTIAALLDEKGIESGRGVAVARNGAVAPRSTWASTPLEAGDEVEIVQAKQGG